MAISFVAAGTIANSSNPTVTVPSGYASGDLLLIFGGSNTAFASNYAPSGWTALYTAASQFSNVWYKFASASESSVSISNSGACFAVMVAYRNVGKIDAIGSYLLQTNTTGITTASFTTTTNNDYVISYYSAGISSTATWTVIPSGTTTRVNQSSSQSSRGGVLIVDELKTTPGATTTRTAGVSNIGNLTRISFSLSPKASITPTNQTVTGSIYTPITSTSAYTAADFTGTVSYAISPTLPTGLSFSTSTGVVSGTPLAPINSTTYTVLANASTYGTASATIGITISTAGDFFFMFN